MTRYLVVILVGAVPAVVLATPSARVAGHSDAAGAAHGGKGAR
jgi:hypothetical protein